MSELGHIAKGLHALCGFSTGVMLTSDMGVSLMSQGHIQPIPLGM